MIPWPSVGASPELGSWLSGRRFAAVSNRPHTVSHPPSIYPTPPYLDEKLQASCPWLFTPETTCSPMVLSALCAQEDQSLTSDYSPWLSLALCYGSRGPYFESTFPFSRTASWLLCDSPAMVLDRGSGCSSVPSYPPKADRVGMHDLCFRMFLAAIPPCRVSWVMPQSLTTAAQICALLCYSFRGLL
jgi:hypothetical protein